MSAVVKDMWKNTTLVCGLHHDHAPEMKLSVGKTYEYKCPECCNSVSILDFEKILDVLSETENEMFLNSEVGSLVGRTFKIAKRLQCKVVDESIDSVHRKISVINLQVKK